MTKRGQMVKDLEANYTSIGNNRYRNLTARVDFVLREIKKASVTRPRLRSGL